MLNTGFLGHVGDVLALGALGVRVCGLPVVGDEKDRVRVLERGFEAVFGVEVGLCG